MKLVGKRRPDAFTVDPRAPRDVHQISGKPPILDGLAHLWVARVQPVPGPVEGKSFHHVGAAKSAEPIFRLEQRAFLPQLERARESGESAADDDDSPTPPHKHPPLPRNGGAFRWRALDPDASVTQVSKRFEHADVHDS